MDTLTFHSRYGHDIRRSCFIFTAEANGRTVRFVLSYEDLADRFHADMDEATLNNTFERNLYSIREAARRAYGVPGVSDAGEVKVSLFAQQ